MIKLNGKVTDDINFYQNNDPFELIERFGSPLYVYNERILRKNCRDIKNMTEYPEFRVNYSVKANSSLALLQIVHQEGLDVEAVSTGEVYAELQAGFKSSQIFYTSNNASVQEMKYAIENNVLLSVDSLSQLERYGMLNPGGKIAVRFNPGIGAGHHEKVVTAGKNTKFGICIEYAAEVKELLKRYSLKLSGINQHIGSLFMSGDKYIESMKNLLSVAEEFEDLEFIDIGGGFGIPYKKQEGEARLNLNELGKMMSEVMESFVSRYGKRIILKVEPGRYIPAEAGVLLGSVHSVKNNYGRKYAGTDLGFNVLIRPTMYDSHHDVEVYVNSSEAADRTAEKVTVVGNICESGDMIANDRFLPEIRVGDVIGVLDTGSYGYSLSSNYNNRQRPAEVLIREDNSVVLIRERDKLEDLLRGQLPLNLYS